MQRRILLQTHYTHANNIYDAHNHLAFATQVIAASDVAAGQEIHNTYGELGNADLLTKYGFALPHNPFDAVQLDKGQLVEAAGKVMSQGMTTRSFRQRRRFLEEHTCDVHSCETLM